MHNIESEFNKLAHINAFNRYILGVEITTDVSIDWSTLQENFDIIKLKYPNVKVFSNPKVKPSHILVVEIDISKKRNEFFDEISNEKSIKFMDMFKSDSSYNNFIKKLHHDSCEIAYNIAIALHLKCPVKSVKKDGMLYYIAQPLFVKRYGFLDILQKNGKVVMQNDEIYDDTTSYLEPMNKQYQYTFQKQPNKLMIVETKFPHLLPLHIKRENIEKSSNKIIEFDELK
jgi:hypothetical protein